MSKPDDADFQEKLRAAPATVQELYHSCLREIDAAERGDNAEMLEMPAELQGTLWVSAESYDDAVAACELLMSRPDHGLASAYAKPPDECPDVEGSGATPTIVITLAPAKKKKKKKKKA